MVVHLFFDAGFENFADNVTRNVFSSGVRVAPAKMHAREIVLAHRRADRNDRRRHVHAVQRSRFFEKVRRRLMSESARAEMYSNPNAVILVRENIHVMVPAADGSKL